MRTISFSACEAHRDRRRRGVGVDVVGQAVDAASDGGDDRDAAGVEQRVDRARLDGHDVTDLADVDRLAVDDAHPPLGREQPAVLAGEADGERTVVVDQVDDVAVDLADEHHAHDRHRLGRRHAKPAAELGVDAEPAEMLGDLRARRRAPRPASARHSAGT